MDRKQIVLEVIAEVSGTDISKLDPETQLVGHLGIDSPRALELLVELEERLDIEIADDEVPTLKTVGDVMTAIERGVGA